MPVDDVVGWFPRRSVGVVQRGDGSLHARTLLRFIHGCVLDHEQRGAVWVGVGSDSLFAQACTNSRSQVFQLVAGFFRTPEPRCGPPKLKMTPGDDRIVVGEVRGAEAPSDPTRPLSTCRSRAVPYMSVFAREQGDLRCYFDFPGVTIQLLFVSGTTSMMLPLASVEPRRSDELRRPARQVPETRE